MLYFVIRLNIEIPHMHKFQLAPLNESLISPELIVSEVVKRCSCQNRTLHKAVIRKELLMRRCSV